MPVGRRAKLPGALGQRCSAALSRAGANFRAPKPMELAVLKLVYDAEAAAALAAAAATARRIGAVVLVSLWFAFTFVGRKFSNLESDEN